MFLKILVLTFALQAQSVTPPQPLVLDWVLGQVASRNLEVQTAGAETRMSQAIAQAAYGWMPPRLELELSGMPWPSPDPSRWMERRYALSQELPFPGRTLLSGRTASHSFRRVSAMARMTLEQKLFEARVAFHQLAAAERMLRALNKTAKALREMAMLSSRRMRMGQLDRMGQFMDVMLAMELSDVESMLPHWQQERRMAEAKLNRLTGAEAERALPAAAFELRDLLEAPRPSLEELWKALLSDNPELEEAQHHIEHARLQKLLAQSGWMPNLMLQGRLSQDAMGVQQSGAMLGLSLPFVWFWRQAGEARAAAAEYDHSKLRREAVLLRLREEAVTAVFEFEAALESLRLTWKRTLPKAEEGLRLARFDFQTTVLGPSEVLMAVQDYRMTEESLAGLIVRAGTSRARLEMLAASRSRGAAQEEIHHEK